MDRTRPLFVHFRPFLITISLVQIEKSIDGVLGIRTCGRGMVGADDTISFFRHGILGTFFPFLQPRFESMLY